MLSCIGISTRGTYYVRLRREVIMNIVESIFTNRVIVSTGPEGIQCEWMIREACIDTHEMVLYRLSDRSCWYYRPGDAPGEEEFVCKVGKNMFHNGHFFVNGEIFNFVVPNEP